MAKYSSTFTISHTVCWFCIAHMHKQAVSVLSWVRTNTLLLHSKSCALPRGRTAINYSTMCSLTSGCRHPCAALNSHTTALIWTHTLSVGSHVHLHTQTHTRKQRLRNMLKILTQAFFIQKQSCLTRLAHITENNGTRRIYLFHSFLKQIGQVYLYWEAQICQSKRTDVQFLHYKPGIYLWMAHLGFFFQMKCILNLLSCT